MEEIGRETAVAVTFVVVVVVGLVDGGFEAYDDGIDRGVDVVDVRAVAEGVRAGKADDVVGVVVVLVVDEEALDAYPVVGFAAGLPVEVVCDGFLGGYITAINKLRTNNNKKR